jgi:HEAT repeat protein
VYKRSYTAQALGQIQTDESTRVLGVLLKDQEEVPQRWAADALILHGKRAIPVLIATLPAGGLAKDQAVRALVAIGKDAVAPLRFVLNDRGAYAAAAEALSKIDGADGTAALVRGAHSADDKLRTASVASLSTAKSSEALQVALDNLSATDKLARVDDAIKALGVLGDPRGTPALLPFLLKDKKTAAATSLGWIRDGRAVEPILAQVAKGDGPYRAAAVLALSRIGGPAIPALVREIHSPDVVMRRAAAEALIGTKAAAANGALVAALSDPDASVRAPAARALGWSGNVSAVGALVGALKDKDWRVVDSAAIALGDIGTDAIGPLAAVLASSQDEKLGYQISRAMFNMGLPAVPALITALGNPSPTVQMWVATALGGINDQRAVPALQKLGAAAGPQVKWVVEEQLRVLTGSTKF